MKRISVLPKGCIGMIGGVPFNPNLERHLKELGEHAAASTTIQASEGVNYVQNGATYTIHISAKALTAMPVRTRVTTSVRPSARLMK